MSKRTVFTTITPLPPSVTRQHVLTTLHNHVEMIDLNPLVIDRHRIKPPPQATPEEFHCIWYLVTDKVSYLPGGALSSVASSKISYPACFHDLANGIQTHIYAPMGLEIRGKWTLGGSLEGEPAQPVEMGLGVPMQGLYVREDVDMRCNILMTGFVKKTLKKAHAQLVQRLSVKAQLEGVKMTNKKSLEQMTTTEGREPMQYAQSVGGSSQGGMASPSFSPNMGFVDGKASPFVPPQLPSQMQQAYRGSIPSPMGYSLPSPPLGGGMQQHHRQGGSQEQYAQQQQGQQFVAELHGHGTKGKEAQSPVEMPAHEMK